MSLPATKRIAILGGGTNEQVFFGKDFLRDFIVTDITPQQEAQLLVMFGNNAKGECLFERLLDTALDNIPQTDKNFEMFLKELEEANNET